MNASALPLLRMALLVGVLALLPLAWWWLRQRDAHPARRLAALTALAAFLTFDLIAFGAFTRLTDSGLGCPDWPGCYGEASPIAAHADIHAAQAAQPTGPVTVGKAWIEMVHRYLAMTLGLLIIVMTAASWRARRALPHSPWWATATLAWVIVQGLFGMFTVTWKLYPAIVTLHLLGGVALLVLLALQRASFLDRPLAAAVSRPAVGAVLALLVVQLALGGWVSTNYAVLACPDFPTCGGRWWPEMDFGHGFTLLRDLGRSAAGDFLPAQALVAIHFVHRAFAVFALAALAALGVKLAREPGAEARRIGWMLLALAAAQLATGLSNIVLGWPIVAALLHTAGAAAMTGLLASLLWRLAPAQAKP